MRGRRRKGCHAGKRELTQASKWGTVLQATERRPLLSKGPNI